VKNKFIILIFAGIIFCAFIVFFSFQNKTDRVCFKENCYKVEIARTQAEKERGLMYREKLSRGQGMLFINNEEGIYSFWMKNMRFPLDIIWLNNNFEVVFIAKNTQPCREKECLNIIPSKPARYILEINAGETDRIGLQLGNKASYEDGNWKVGKN
jgi:uncharacterized membrane protein (UPF0127 family)